MFYIVPLQRNNVNIENIHYILFNRHDNVFYYKWNNNIDMVKEFKRMFPVFELEIRIITLYSNYKVEKIDNTNFVDF